MLESGAVGYLNKGCSLQEMLQAVRCARAGQRYVGADVAQHMVLDQLDGNRTPIHSLSARELEVMVMVSQGNSLRDIASKLCLSPKTVSTYRARVMEKLGVASDVELTHIALRYGLVEPGETA